MTGDAAPYRTAIASAFPDLRIEALRFLAEGWDSTVWEVNGDLVFRFPKRAEVGAWLRIEIDLLPKLSPTLPVPVPHFSYIADAPVAFSYPFVGYQKLPGLALGDAPSHAVPAERLAAQIGAFLTALHDFPIAQAIACGVPEASAAQWRAQQAAMLADLRSLFPRMTREEQTRTESLFGGYLDNPAYGRFTPVLLHRDLGGEHILVDSKSGDLAGVIDWGDVSIGDPAQDFCGLPAAWLPTLLAHYGRKVDATFTDRATFYRALKPYHTLVFGLHAGGEQFIARGLAELRETGPFALGHPLPPY
jgi:aminoglycoside 2''-phosphotransferase